MLISDHATDLIWMARGDRNERKPPVGRAAGNHDLRKVLTKMQQ